MKKVHFNTIDNLTTPEDWKKKALSIPEAYAQKQPVITPLWQWAVTAAACFIALVSVSLMLFVGMDKRNQFEIRLIYPEATSSPTIAENCSESAETFSTQPADSESSANTESSDRTGNQVIRISRIQQQPAPLSTVVSSEPPISPSTQPETGDTEPVQSPSETSATPTHPATEHSVIPPTIPMTEPAFIQTDTPTQPADAPSEEYLDRITRTFYVPPNWMIYCRITDLSGEIIYGAEDIYDDDHLCEVVEGTKLYTVCTYSPKDHEILPERGCYLCEFYDAYGAVLLTEKVYLNN